MGLYLFGYMLKMLIYFLSDGDILLILEFKNSFGKYHPVFIRNLEREFLGHPVEIDKKKI